MRCGLHFDRFQSIPPWFLLALLLAVHGAANYLYARLSSTDYLMNMYTIHYADYHMVFGYRFLTGPPYHLQEEDLSSCFIPSMGVGVEGRRPFSWKRAKHLFRNQPHREYNPFYLIPVAFWSSIWGPSATAIVFTPTLYLLILLFFTFLCGREIRGSVAGLAAAIFVGLIPWVIGLSRYGRSYICLIAACAISYYLLLKTDRFSRPAYSLLFVASFALGFHAVPTRTEFLLLLLAMVGPVLVYARAGLFRRERRFRTIVIIASLCAVAVLLESRWHILDYMNQTRFRADLVRSIRGNVFRHPMAILSYPVHLLLIQLSPVVTLCAAYPIWKCFRRASLHGLALALMFLLPLVVLTYIQHKQPLYITYLCLPLALAAGAGVIRLRRKKAVWFALIILSLSCIVWRSIPIGRIWKSKTACQSTWVKAVDTILWGGACQAYPFFQDTFFNYNYSICFSTMVHPDSLGSRERDPEGIIERLSRIDGLRVGLVFPPDGELFIMKWVEMLALNPTITVHLFNGMPNFYLTVEDIDLIIVRVTGGGEFEKWLESGEFREVPPSILDEVGFLCFHEDDQSMQAFLRFVRDLKDKADLR